MTELWCCGGWLDEHGRPLHERACPASQRQRQAEPVPRLELGAGPVCILCRRALTQDDLTGLCERCTIATRHDAGATNGGMEYALRSRIGGGFEIWNK